MSFDTGWRDLRRGIVSAPEAPNADRSSREQLKELEASLARQDAAEWVTRHRKFYRTIFDLSPEKVLVEEVMR